MSSLSRPMDSPAEFEAELRARYDPRYRNGKRVRRRIKEMMDSPVDRVAPAAGSSRQLLAIIEADLVAAWGRTDGTAAIITMPANSASGFDVSLHVTGGTIHANFGGLAEAFGSPEEAMIWVRRATAEGYDLITAYRGNAVVTRRLAPHFGDGPELLTGEVRFLPSFGAKRETVRSNGSTSSATAP